MLQIIVFTLFTSLIINLLLRKLHLPTIIGYIVTGAVITYGFDLHDAAHNHQLKEIAEFGVVFLMFTIGLEFSIEHLKKMKSEIFLTGTLQIVLTALGAFVLGHYVLGVEQKMAFILSLAVSLSSTAIVLKTFNESGEIGKRFGQRSLGILIMQDIAVIPILLVIGFMSSQSNDPISSLIYEMVVGGLLLLGIMWLVGKYMLEPFFTQILKTNLEELLIGTILFLAIGASYLAHVFGFSYSLGAFVAGILIAETKYKHQVESELIPFRDILLGVFFITVGMQIDFGAMVRYAHWIALVLVVAMVLKFVIIFALVRFGENTRVSLKTALSLVQIGEFSLALLELAKTNDLLHPVYGQIMLIVIIISMIITPIILKNLTFVADLLGKDEVIIDETKPPTITPKGHIVILGFGEFGQNVANMLESQSIPYIAAEYSIDNYHQAVTRGQNVIFGSVFKKEILKQLCIQDATNVIIAINNPKKLLYICEIITTLVPLDKIIVKVHNDTEKQSIEELGIRNIVVDNTISSECVIRLCEEEEGVLSATKS